MQWLPGPVVLGAAAMECGSVGDAAGSNGDGGGVSRITPSMVSYGNCMCFELGLERWKKRALSSSQWHPIGVCLREKPKMQHQREVLAFQRVI